MAELCAAGEAELGVRLEPGALARLAAYGRSVAHFPTAVKELEWRNGWFDAISQAALAPQPSPVRPPPRLAAAALWLLPPLSWSTTPVLACNPAVISLQSRRPPSPVDGPTRCRCTPRGCRNSASSSLHLAIWSSSLLKRSHRVLTAASGQGGFCALARELSLGRGAPGDSYF